MPKKSKLKTPDWILEGYDSLEEYNKARGITSKKKAGKTFKIKECPKCESRDVKIVLSNNIEENSGKEWECMKCGWRGMDILKKELTEEEMMKYLDEKGEEVA